MICGLAPLALFLTAILIPGCGGGSNTYNPALISEAPSPASFRVAVAPPSVTVTAGQAATYTVTVTAVNAFSSAVNLSVGGLPAGAAGTFSPASVTPTAAGVTSTLTITTSDAAARSRTSKSRSARTAATVGPNSRAPSPGITTTFTVIGASSNLTSSATADIVVIPAAMPSFMITAGGTQTVRAGESASYDFTVTSVNGFAGAVTFSATNLPAGAAATFNPTSITPTANGTASAALTIQTAANTPAGTSMPTIVGTSGALTNQAAETLVVTAASTIATLEVTPPTSTIQAGATVQLTATAKDASGNVVQVAPANITWTSGTPATATVNASGLVTGVADSATPVTITATESESHKSGSASVTVMTAGGCAPGVVMGPGGIATAAWPKAGADVRNTGRGKGSGATPTLKWVVSTGGDSAGFQATIGPDGTVYDTDYGTAGLARLYARNPSDGSVKWSFTSNTHMIVTIPTVGRNGLVYFADGTTFHAVNAQTGVQQWSVEQGLAKSATIGLDGVVYLATFNGLLRAYDGDTGTQKWSALPGDGQTGWYWTSPALGADGTLYVGKVSGGLVAIDGTNGCTRWTDDSVGSVGGTAVGDDGTVYATVQPPGSGTPTRVIAVDPATGAIKWTTDNVPGHDTPPAIGQDGTVYVLGPRAELTALNPTTGAVKWADPTPGPGSGNRASPAIGSDGTIYFLSMAIFGGTLFAINPADGTQKWAFALPNNNGLAVPTDATPTVDADGTIYVCTFGPGAGQLIAVR